jgi:predicted  nucleic acid-binding Zn ribbon protein
MVNWAKAQNYMMSYYPLAEANGNSFKRDYYDKCPFCWLKPTAIHSKGDYYDKCPFCWLKPTAIHSKGIIMISVLSVG